MSWELPFLLCPTLPTLVFTGNSGCLFAWGRRQEAQTQEGHFCPREEARPRLRCSKESTFQDTKGDCCSLVLVADRQEDTDFSSLLHHPNPYHLLCPVWQEVGSCCSIMSALWAAPVKSDSEDPFFAQPLRKMLEKILKFELLVKTWSGTVETKN